MCLAQPSLLHCWRGTSLRKALDLPRKRPCCQQKGRKLMNASACTVCGSKKIAESKAMPTKAYATGTAVWWHLLKLLRHGFQTLVNGPRHEIDPSMSKCLPSYSWLSGKNSRYVFGLQGVHLDMQKQFVTWCACRGRGIQKRSKSPQIHANPIYPIYTGTSKRNTSKRKNSKGAYIIQILRHLTRTAVCWKIEINISFCQAKTIRLYQLTCIEPAFSPSVTQTSSVFIFLRPERNVCEASAFAREKLESQEPSDTKTYKSSWILLAKLKQYPKASSQHLRNRKHEINKCLQECCAVPLQWNLCEGAIQVTQATRSLHMLDLSWWEPELRFEKPLPLTQV